MSDEGGKPGAPAAPYGQWLSAAAVGTIGGGTAALIGLPVPWLVGSLISGLITSVFLGRRLSVPAPFLAIAQCAIGLTVGLSFSIDTITSLGRAFPAVILVLTATTAASLANGYLLSKWTEIDRSSGLLGSIPGAASAMVAAADKVGADARAVAVLQYVRLLFILIVVPPLLAAWTDPSQSTAVATMDLPVEAATNRAPWFILLPGLALLGLAGALLGQRLRFPSPYVLGPMTLSMGLGTLFPDVAAAGFSVPPAIFAAALLVIGTSVGLRFDKEVLGTLRRAVAIQLLLLLGLLGVSAVLAFLLYSITEIDLETAVMGNIPGALEGMIAVSMDLGASAAIVAAMHTMRSVSLLCVGPWIVRGLQRAPQGQRPAA